MNSTPPASFTQGSAGERYVIAAERVFDGTRVLEQHAVAVSGDRIVAVAPADRLRGSGHLIRFAGTLLPGFIDLHTHLLFDQTPQETILRHGLTTVRDTGGPLVPPSGGDERLRVLGAGPILTAPGGYPIPVFGAQELLLMLHTAHGALTPLDVLSAATARAGEHLGLAPLGQLVEGAPADFIGVRGNPLERFKLLEYPDLVVSGGVTIVAPGQS
jgi:imidazolonepropionase-like amidohydrolase